MSEGQERRQRSRSRTLKKGQIVFKNRYCSHECFVRNESAGGALLMISQNHVIPSEFELNVYPRKDYRPAIVVWRTPEALGVRFTDVENSEAPTTDGHPNAIMEAARAILALGETIPQAQPQDDAPAAQNTAAPEHMAAPAPMQNPEMQPVADPQPVQQPVEPVAHVASPHMQPEIQPQIPTEIQPDVHHAADLVTPSPVEMQQPVSPDPIAAPVDPQLEAVQAEEIFDPEVRAELVDPNIAYEAPAPVEPIHNQMSLEQPAPVTETVAEQAAETLAEPDYVEAAPQVMAEPSFVEAPAMAAHEEQDFDALPDDMTDIAAENVAPAYVEQTTAAQEDALSRVTAETLDSDPLNALKAVLDETEEILTEAIGPMVSPSVEVHAPEISAPGLAEQPQPMEIPETVTAPPTMETPEVVAQPIPPVVEQRLVEPVAPISVTPKMAETVENWTDPAPRAPAPAQNTWDGVDRRSHHDRRASDRRRGS